MLESSRIEEARICAVYAKRENGDRYSLFRPGTLFIARNKSTGAYFAHYAEMVWRNWDPTQFLESAVVLGTGCVSLPVRSAARKRAARRSAAGIGSQSQNFMFTGGSVIVRQRRRPAVIGRKL